MAQSTKVPELVLEYGVERFSVWLLNAEQQYSVVPLPLGSVQARLGFLFTGKLGMGW